MANLAFGKLSDYLQLPTHRLDVGAQTGDIHVSPMFELCDGRLVHVERLGQVLLGERSCPSQLVQRHLGK